jgi:hypothetical protein
VACPSASAPLEATLPGFSWRNLLEFLQPRSAIAVRQSVPAFLPAKASAGPPLLRLIPLQGMPPRNKSQLIKNGTGTGRLLTSPRSTLRHVPQATLVVRSDMAAQRTSKKKPEQISRGFCLSAHSGRRPCFDLAICEVKDRTGREENLVVCFHRAWSHYGRDGAQQCTCRRDEHASRSCLCEAS